MNKNISNKIFIFGNNVDYLEQLSLLICEKASFDINKIAKSLVILPNKRSTLLLKKAFVDVFQERTGQAAVIIPNIVSLNNLDEDLININSLLNNDKVINYNNVITREDKLFIISELISNSEYFKKDNLPLSQAVKFAISLVKDYDIINKYELDASNLELAEFNELSIHKQIGFDFFKDIYKKYKQYLQDNNLQDNILFQNLVFKRFITILNAKADKNLPYNNQNLFIAGTTGSLAITAELIKSILHSNNFNGYYCLPYIEQQLSDDDYATISGSCFYHQYFIHKILAYLDVNRNEVSKFHLTKSEEPSKLKERFLSYSLLPAQHIEKWRNLAKEDYFSLYSEENNILPQFIECEDEFHEASVISKIIYQYYTKDINIKATADKPKKIAVISESNDLFELINHNLAKLGVKADNSYGRIFNYTSEACLFSQIAKFLDDRQIISLVTIFKNELVNIEGFSRAEVRDIAFRFEIMCRKNNLLTINNLKNSIEEKSPLNNLVESSIYQEFSFIINFIKEFWDEEEKSEHKKKYSLREIFKLNKHLFDKLLEDGFSSDAKEKLTNFADFILSRKGTSLDSAHDLSLYRELLDTYFSSFSLHATYGFSPNISLIKPIEARLNNFDIVILASMNEGIFPSKDFSPWISDSIKISLGIADNKQESSLALHDITQHLGASKVFISYCKRINSEPTQKATFVNKMLFFYNYMGATKAAYYDLQQLDTKFTKELNDIEKKQPKITYNEYDSKIFLKVNRANMPKYLSYSDINNLLSSPYIFYAKKILKLKPLDRFGKDKKAQNFGIFLHRILEVFAQKHSYQNDKITHNLYEQTLEDVFSEYHSKYRLNATDKYKALLLSDYIVAMEQKNSHNIKLFYTEESASFAINLADVAKHVNDKPLNSYDEHEHNYASITLKAKADKIDLLFENATNSLSYNIVDYKTGSAPNAKDMISLKAAQLPLEGYLLTNYSFGFQQNNLNNNYSTDNINFDKILLTYEKLSVNYNSCTSVKEVFTPNLYDDLQDNLYNLLNDLYLTDKYFLIYPDREKISEYDDYLHLQRV